MKSKGIVAPAKGKVEVQDVEIPDPAPNELQVRVHSSVISPGTERAFILNLSNANTTYPHRLGYATAGTVVKVGRDVTRFKEGDRVASFGIRHGGSGNIREDRTVGLPDNVSFDLAAFTALGVICMQGVRKARIELGESVMVIGLGPIGQIALQLARLNGAIPAIGVDKVEKRLRLAERCGADGALDSSSPDWQKRLAERCGTGPSAGPEVVIESTGFPEPIDMALAAVRNFGRVVLLGSTRGENRVNFYSEVHKKGTTIIGAHISSNPQHESHPGYWTWAANGTAFMKLISSGRVAIEPLITECVSWQQAETLYARLIAWDVDMMGAVIHWDAAV